MATAQTMGQRIVAARLAKGWNRSQLVRALGVAQTTVIAWEQDRVSSMDFENLEALSVVLGVPASWLRGEDQSVTEPQFEAWREFLQTSAGKSMNKAERQTLASVKFQPPLDATADVYHALLIGLRMGGKN